MLGEIFCRSQISSALALWIVGDDFALGRCEHCLPRFAITLSDEIFSLALRDDDEKPGLPIMPARTHRSRLDNLDDKIWRHRIGLQPAHRARRVDRFVQIEFVMAMHERERISFRVASGKSMR